MGDIAEASTSEIQRDIHTVCTGNEPASIEQVPGSSEAEERQICPSSWVMIECREFLKRTLSCLSAKQLNTCTRVCRVWRKEANRILSKRQNLNWVSAFRLTNSITEEVSHPLGAFGNSLQQTLEAADSQPKFALMFTEYAKGSEYRSNGTTGPKKSQEVVDLIKSLLPRDCVYLSLMTPGTVGPKSSNTTKPDEESEQDGGAVCALFPSMPGVEVKILPISPKLLQGGYKEDLWQQWLDAGISPGDTQCILLFGWGFISGVQQAAMELQRLFQEKARRNPVIAGGIVNRLLSKGLCSKTQESSGVIGVMFSGPNVRAASVLLNEQISKRDEVKNTIATLKEAHLPVKPKHSLALMFACAGRGRYFYNEDNVESEEFHKVFPDTPLFGFFGGGEIGCRNLTAGREIDGLCLQTIAHAYTTIMCLLTFDPS